MLTLRPDRTEANNAQIDKLPAMKVLSPVCREVEPTNAERNTINAFIQLRSL